MYTFIKENESINIHTKSIQDQKLYYITRGYSHDSILDLVKDIHVRDKYNLLFPFYSNEADEVEKDAEKHQKVEKSESNNIIEEDSDDSLEFLPYFHGDILREEAESRLKEKNVGSFLIRF